MQIRTAKETENSLIQTKYEVLVDDNFHYQDEDERIKLGAYGTLEEALLACKKIVDDFLAEGYKPGMAAEELYGEYISMGQDPFIRRPAIESEMGNAFSAWTYAEERCNDICGKTN